MFQTLRRALAYVRGRWHADLAFQRTSMHGAIVERLDDLLAQSDANYDFSVRADSQWTELQRITSAGVDSIAARLATLESADARTRDALASLERADAQTRDLLASVETLLSEGLLKSARQSTCLSEALTSQGQTLEQALSALTLFSQELHDEQRRQREWEARWELELERDRAAAAKRRTRKTRRQKLTRTDRTAIERQGLFVVGSARSGTTILSDCLNLSRDAYMLQEAFFFCSELAAKYVGKDKYDFAATFNARHVSYGNPRDKGTYVPTAATRDRTPLEFLNRLRSKYRYLGEKLAFGPQPHYMGENWENDFLAFQARYFYHSQYFLTVRAPHEALWSMHKFFPDRKIATLFECWLRSLRTVLELYGAFPNTHVVLLERLDPATIVRIADTLQITIPPTDKLLGRAYQASALGEGQLVRALEPYREWCDECTSLYEQVRKAFCPISLQYTFSSPRRNWLHVIRQQVGCLLDEVLCDDSRAAEAA